MPKVGLFDLFKRYTNALDWSRITNVVHKYASTFRQRTLPASGVIRGVYLFGERSTSSYYSTQTLNIQ